MTEDAPRVTMVTTATRHACARTMGDATTSMEHAPVRVGGGARCAPSRVHLVPMGGSAFWSVPALMEVPVGLITGSVCAPQDTMESSVTIHVQVGDGYIIKEYYMINGFNFCVRKNKCV